jgi:hypothetical protein
MKRDFDKRWTVTTIGVPLPNFLHIPGGADPPAPESNL